MKYILLFFLISIKLSAQTYNFNKLFLYEGNYTKRVLYKHDKIESQYLDLNYFNNKSRIIDLKNFKIHILNTITTIDSVKKEYSHEFIFDKTIPIDKNIHKGFYKNLITKLIQESKINDSLFRYRIELYKNKKKQKPFIIINIEAEKSEVNHFDIFKLIGLHPFENNENFLINENLLIHKAEWINLNSKKCTLILKEYKNVNFSIIVP